MKLGVAPFIKWTGSKRPQAKAIVDLFPKNIDTYYECFLGGGSVMHEVMNRVLKGEMKVNKFICSDLNSDLIGIWNLFKNNRDEYEEVYHTLGDTADGTARPDARRVPEGCGAELSADQTV